MNKFAKLADRVDHLTGLRTDVLSAGGGSSGVNVYAPDNKSRLQVVVSAVATAEDLARHEREIVAAVTALGWAK